jgi:hypothetical protein
MIAVSPEILERYVGVYRVAKPSDANGSEAIRQANANS